MEPVKKPEACENIQEIRDAIDLIDQEIIQRFAERHAYVKEIVKFKTGDEDSIIAQERKDQVLKDRKAWAAKRGLDPGMMEDLFKLLIDKNIQIQFDIHNSSNK